MSHYRESQLMGKVRLSETYETVCLALPDGSFGRGFHCIIVKSLNLSFNSLILSLKSRKNSGCHVQDVRSMLVRMNINHCWKGFP